jgi:hypothetical protein
LGGEKEEVVVKKTFKGMIVGASALAILGAVSPAASANAAGDTTHGGCFFNTDENALATNGQNQGAIGDLSATTDPSGAPTGATVTCWIEVNNVEAPGTRHSYSGTGVQAGTDQITFTASDTDTVTECMTVTYADGTTEPEDCPGATTLVLPPQQVIDLLDSVFTTLENEEIALVDPVVCPVLVTLGQATGGGVPGVLEIRADGDVYTADPLGLGINPVWDCPPYGNF